MELISNMLFWLSNGMLIPDIIFLLFFFIKALLMIGGFYGTYIARTKINVKLNREIGKTGVEEFLDTLPEGNGKSKLLEYLRKIKAAPQDRALREKLLGDYEIAADKELGQSKLLVKIGPMLGLMGTLIPMGPALVGLATGDIGSMAYNMPGGLRHHRSRYRHRRNRFHYAPGKAALGGGRHEHTGIRCRIPQ